MPFECLSDLFRFFIYTKFNEIKAYKIIFFSIFPQRYLNRQDANQISYESYVDNEKYSIYVRFWIIIK